MQRFLVFEMSVVRSICICRDAIFARLVDQKHGGLSVRNMTCCNTETYVIRHSKYLVHWIMTLHSFLLLSVSVPFPFCSIFASTVNAQPSATDPQNAALIELGRTLFFDVRLSQDGTVSCAFCHQPEKGFTDGKSVAQGIHGRHGTRNTPSLRNVAYTPAKFWDGRRPTLESQVLDPFFNPNEHGLRDQGELLSKLSEGAPYKNLMPKALGIQITHVTPANIAQALSAYLLSLTHTETRLERYLFKRDTTALTLNERRGLDLFRGSAQCTTCHLILDTEVPLTDGEYHSLALGFEQLVPKLVLLTKTVSTTPRQELDRLISSDPDIAALGRFVVTLHPADIGKFKTPSLRNVADTAPYMHDGSVATLEEAVNRELYYRGKAQGRPLTLNLAERADLLAFLKTLTDVPIQRQE